MRRDLTLIRDLLLEIESKHDGSLQIIKDLGNQTEALKVTEHLFLLLEAGFIDAIDASSSSGRELMVMRLTWNGHDFLDSIRDPLIWQKTEMAATNAGSWTFDLVKDLASAYVRQKIAAATGLTF
jgi:hypothetical protein